MESDATIFLNYVNNNYDKVGGTLKLLSAQRKQKFDEDAFHESILRCHKAIEKKGYLNDKSGYGITSYLIRAYFNLINEEKRSAKVKKRDQNYNSDNIGGLYEDYYNSNFTDARQKVVSDLFRDYAVLYVMMIAEQNFDSEHFYLFKLKELCKDMTYKKLSEKTKIKGVRQKVVEVKRFIQTNVTKDEIRKSFFETFGDIL
jgi:hypothetical protein